MKQYDTKMINSNHCIGEIINLFFDLNGGLYGARTIDEFEETTKHLFVAENLDGYVTRVNGELLGACLYCPLNEEGVEIYNQLQPNLSFNSQDIEVLTFISKDNEKDAANVLMDKLTFLAQGKIIFPHQDQTLLNEVTKGYGFREIDQIQGFYPSGEHALVKIYPRRALFEIENNLKKDF